MKARLFSSLVFTVALVGLLWAGPAAQNAPTLPDKKTEYVGKKAVENDVELLIRVPKETPAGRPLELEITLTNLGKEPVRHGQINNYYDFDFSVSDSQGKPVRYTRFGEPFLGKKLEDVWKFDILQLPPGASYSWVFNLGLLFDLTVRGKYAVTVGKEVNPNREDKFLLEAKGLEFAVSEPPPIIAVEKKGGQK